MGSTMLAWNARPRPEIWGPKWREEWFKRMDHTPATLKPGSNIKMRLILETWFDLWDFSEIECAVFAVGGGRIHTAMQF